MYGLIQGIESPRHTIVEVARDGQRYYTTGHYSRAMDDFRHIPVIAVIAVTAHATRDDEVRSLAAGCTVHVNKPFDLDTLLNQIISLLPACSS